MKVNAFVTQLGQHQWVWVQCMPSVLTQNSQFNVIGEHQQTNWGNMELLSTVVLFFEFIFEYLNYTVILIFISLIDQDNPGFSKLSWYIYPLTSCQSLITYNNRIRIDFVLCINCNWFKVLPSPSATIANLLHMPCYHYFKSGTCVWHIKLVPWNSHLHSECRSSLGRQYEMACACNIMKIDCLVYFRD